MASQDLKAQLLSQAACLTLGYEDGGYRHFLRGKPVHAGEQLRLWRDGKWVWARYEWDWNTAHDPALYLAGDVLRENGTPPQ